MYFFILSFSIKVFIIHIICLVGVKYSTACEDWPTYSTTVELKCEANTKILILKADFGRDKYSIACDDKYYNGDCTSSLNTEEVMKNLCGNKQTCEVTPTPDVFGDPCPYVTKLLRVWYQCVGDGKNVLSEN